jgi:ABC-type amino acid transport substrate-binding protein
VLQQLRLGVVAGTPPATLLTRYELMGQTRPYQRTVDTRHFAPASQAVADVARGEIDVAVVWGPIAAFASRRQEIALRVIPLPAKEDAVTLAFNVSMGIRRRETAWKHQLNGELEKLAPQIEEILVQYGIPLLDESNRLIND